MGAAEQPLLQPECPGLGAAVGAAGVGTHGSQSAQAIATLAAGAGRVLLRNTDLQRKTCQNQDPLLSGGGLEAVAFVCAVKS